MPGPLCEHGRRKARRKACGGSRVCERGRVRRICPHLKAARLAAHLTPPAFCPDRGVVAVRAHGPMWEEDGAQPMPRHADGEAGQHTADAMVHALDLRAAHDANR